MKGKSTKKPLILGFLMIITLFTVIYMQNVQANEQNIIPDKKVIANRVHLNKIKTFDEIQNKEDRLKAINYYLSQLSVKDLLETAAEYSPEKDFEQTAQILVPHFKRLWAEDVPYSEAKKIILDKTHHSKFRIFVLDGITNSANMKGYQSEDVTDTLLAIAQDNTDNEDVRRYALHKLRKPGAFSKTTSLINNNVETELLNIYNDQAAPAKVKAAVITSMRRTGDHNFNGIVKTILSEPEKYPTIIVRHAVIDGAKSGVAKDYINNLENLAATTQDPEIYASTVYALGIIGGQDAVKAVISLYGKYDNADIGNFALLSNQKTILSMLDLKQSEETISVGITAANLINLHSSTELLQQIADNSKNQKLQNDAIAALNKIKNAPKWKNSNKWEDK